MKLIGTLSFLIFYIFTQSQVKVSDSNFISKLVFKKFADSIGKVKQDFLYYNVKTFGAKGDGVTDDSKAIQSVINFYKNSVNTDKYLASTPSGNGLLKLYFPRGIYKINGTLDIFCGMVLEGESAGAINVTALVQADLTRPLIQVHPKNYNGRTVVNNSNGINTFNKFFIFS
jgi:hypothetical protein